MTTTRPQSRTLGDLLDELAAATPQAPALVSGAERLDFAALKARTDGFARACSLSASAAASRGTAVLEPQRMGGGRLRAAFGAPVAAISTFSSPRGLAYALEHSGAKALVMLSRFRDRHFLQALGEALPELALPRRLAERRCQPCGPSSCWTAMRRPALSAGGIHGARRRRRCSALARAQPAVTRTTSASSSTPRAPPPRPRA